MPIDEVSCDHSGMREFTDLGLSDAVAQAFAALGFAAPTEIQKLVIPAIMSKHDAYISSATGTGKTFAYIAPILSSIDVSARTVQAIVVSPTHDLAAQIERETTRLAEAAGIPVRIVSALGSVPLKRQLDRLADKPHIVIGSAGRIRDLALGGHIDLASCQWAILDEADRLFENEAIDISSELLTALPQTCSRALVSASLPARTVDRSAPWFRDPLKLIIDPSEALRNSIEHWCFHSASRSKLDFLRRFEAAVKPERCLLFASSNAAIFTIQKRLDFLGFPAAVLKSDKDGSERHNALTEFSNGTARWLITTDLGARGLDLPDVSHVISFDLPEEPTIYMHRAGRTGRAGKHGVSVALADLVELKRASKIAVRYSFPFVCKILDSGLVHDIEPENFFAIAEEEEAARKDVKLEGTKRPIPGRRPRPGVVTRPSGMPPRTGGIMQSRPVSGSIGPNGPEDRQRRPSSEDESRQRRVQGRSEQGRSDQGRSDQGRSRPQQRSMGQSGDGRTRQNRDQSQSRPQQPSPAPVQAPGSAPESDPNAKSIPPSQQKRRHRHRKGGPTGPVGPKEGPSPTAE